MLPNETWLFTAISSIINPTKFHAASDYTTLFRGLELSST